MKRRSRVGGGPIKGRRRKTPEPKRRNAPKAVARSNSPPAREETEVARLRRERNEALEQQTATSEVLQTISSSTGDLEPVFGTILEKAVRYCDANFGTLFLYEKDQTSLVAAHNMPAAFSEAHRRSPGIVPGGPGETAMRTRRTVHVPDLAATQSYLERHPRAVEAVELGGVRTVVAVPLLKDDEPIGLITINRPDVRPFTDKQIDLLANFATQAVIAIENARLLNALRQRTDDLSQRTADLTEALEQQTAASGVLQVISRSPGDLEPVFASMLEKAVRICDATFGNIYRWDGEFLSLVAAHNTPPAFAEARRLPRRPNPNNIWTHARDERSGSRARCCAAGQGR
jgi:transcriptional regulator with GAF, ATPase, and Fis domain